MRKFIHFFTQVAFVYVFVGFLLFIFQRNFIYFPTPKYNHPYHTDIFYHDNESIEVIVLNKEQEKSILFFGGNAEAVVNNAEEYIINFPDYTVYLVNYRGYGGSSGSTQERTIYMDALYIYDEIKKKHTGISIIGRSLGTGVATYVSSKRNIEKMILITPYDSLESLAKYHYPIYPITLLLKDKFDSVSRVKNIKSPALIVLAEYDRVIPLKSSMRLINAFPSSQVSVEIIENTGHNSISEKAEFHSLLREFMR